jgi:hypothetical protein
MRAQTTSCAYKPLPYVLLRRSADDVPAAVIPKIKGLQAAVQALRALFKRWAGHDRTRTS